MAVYEYQCEGCGEKFEVWTIFKEETKCPSCGSADVGRLMSASSFKLKGSGWYATDYKGKSPGSAPPPAEADTSSCEEAGTKPQCATCPASESNA